MYQCHQILIVTLCLQLVREYACVVFIKLFGLCNERKLPLEAKKQAVDCYNVCPHTLCNLNYKDHIFGLVLNPESEMELQGTY